MEGAGSCTKYCLSATFRVQTEEIQRNSQSNKMWYLVSIKVVCGFESGL